MSEPRTDWRRHPLVPPAIALGGGLLLALLLSRTMIVGSWHVQLPTWLATLLSDTGDRDLILERPSSLWLVPLALAPYLIATAARSLVDLPMGQVVGQTVSRTLLLLAVALALTLPHLSAPIRGKSLVFVLDVSESIDDQQLAAAEDGVREALAAAHAEVEAGIPREDRTRVRVVTYGRRARALDLDAIAAFEAGASLRLPDDPETSGDALLGSDHAAGLRLAEALLDPETEPHVVLMTDGTGDLAEREQLAITAQRLRERRVHVHTRSFPAQTRGDVIVEAVHLPEELRVGQSFDVAIDLVSSTAGDATLSLRRNGEPNPLAPQQTVTLRPGRQQVKMPARVTEPGVVVFTASLDASTLPEGTNRTERNDEAAAVGDVKGRPRVLYVGNDETGALPRALRADHLSVDARSPGAIPAEAAELRDYDLVVISDVAARRIGGAQQQAIVEHVRERGAGFIMVGGEGSFGVGGWKGTPLDRILPVRYDGERQREQPTLALLLVIDKSGSMSSEDKLDLVKEAARATARALDPSDQIGVIAFDSRPHVLVRLQRAAARFRISSDIRRLAAGGGTNALPALREAYLQLVGSNALIKHVILLSDGQSPEAGIYPLISDMRDADITVSTVGVGAGAGKDLLARIAQRGRGRYYFSQDGTDVPRIFSRETKEVTRNALVERELYPRVAKPVQALRGIDFDRAPGLRGIVPVKPKPQAETILRTHLGDALLVRGRSGLGKTVAFASDAKPQWAINWISWSGFPKFWSQVARDVMRTGAGDLGGASIQVFPAATGGAYRVVVDVESTAGFANDLSGHVEVVDPANLADASDDTGDDAGDDANGSSGDATAGETLELVLTAPGRYEAEVRDVAAGQRLLRAKLYSGQRGSGTRRLAAEAQAQVSVPYPAELSPAQLEPHPEWVAALGSPAATSEGPLRPVVEKPGQADGRTRENPLWPLVVAFLVVPLLVLDLLLRRVALGVRSL